MVGAHSVIDSFVKEDEAYLRAWSEAGWLAIGMDEAIGGVPAPSMVAWAINEFVLGAQDGLVGTVGMVLCSLPTVLTTIGPGDVVKVEMSPYDMSRGRINLNRE